MGGQFFWCSGELNDDKQKTVSPKYYASRAKEYFIQSRNGSESGNYLELSKVFHLPGQLN